MAWPIAEVARMSGVTARTLRHYDEIGLLSPARIGTNGHRYYEERQLLQRQQILYCARWAWDCPRSAGSWPRRSLSWRPCAATGVAWSQSVTGSMPWPARSPARSLNWSSPGRTGEP